MAEKGRPSEYKEEYIEKVDEYLAICEDEYLKVVKQANAEKGYEMFDERLKVNLPTHEGFALFIDVNPTTLYEWEKKHPLFSKALARIKSKQRGRLIDMGLSGEYNSTIAKLILSSNHGMSEKQIVDNTIKGSISLTDLFNKAKKDE